MSATNGAAIGPRQMAELARLVVNAYTGGRPVRGQSAGRRRDVEAECGYPRDLTAQEYADLIDRDPFACRANLVVPESVWSVHPEVYEDPDADAVTPFEKAFADLNSQLTGGSLLAQESGAALWSWLYEADAVCGVGRYGCLLLGTDDGGALEDEPIPKKGMKLTHLRAFDECGAKITGWEENPASPRYGQPTMYELSFRSPGGDGTTTENHDVHWRRVLHFTDGAGPVFSRPRLRPALWPIWNLQKVLMSDAEGYWQWGFPVFALQTPPEFGGEVDIDEDAAREAFAKIFDGLQRWLIARGAEARTLSPELADPTPHVMVQVQSLCVYLGVPLRQFLGSEEGKLASGQDSRRWHARLRGIRKDRTTPHRIAPLVDRLIGLGVLPAPQRYFVWWPDAEAMSETERADVAQKVSQALATYGNSPGAQACLGREDYLTAVLGRTPSEAASMLERAEPVPIAQPVSAPPAVPEDRRGMEK